MLGKLKTKFAVFLDRGNTSLKITALLWKSAVSLLCKFSWYISTGITRLDGAQGKKQVWPPMVEPEVFWKQMCRIEKITCDIVVIFNALPLQWLGAAIMIWPPGNCAPLALPRYARVHLASPAKEAHFCDCRLTWGHFLCVFFFSLCHKAFCERPFALHRQQHENDKQSVDVSPPGKISADAHGYKHYCVMHHAVQWIAVQLQGTIASRGFATWLFKAQWRIHWQFRQLHMVKCKLRGSHLIKIQYTVLTKERPKLRQWSIFYKFRLLSNIWCNRNHDT